MESLDKEEASKLTALMAQLKLPSSPTTPHEPLADPLTVLRFLRARDGNVESAAKMYTSTIAFRKTKIHSLMALYGSTPDEFDGDGTRLTPATSWNWTRAIEGNNDAILLHKIGFFGRLTIDGPDDAPVAIWRLGACDMFGYKENKLVEYMCDAFAVHLEDLLQAGRAASLKHNKMVRARLIIDVGGVGLSTLPLIKTLKSIIVIGKQYFPECTATATIINAPWVFSSLWVVVKPILTKVMQKKGENKNMDENEDSAVNKHDEGRRMLLKLATNATPFATRFAHCTCFAHCSLNPEYFLGDRRSIHEAFWNCSLCTSCVSRRVHLRLSVLSVRARRSEPQICEQPTLRGINRR
jgi:hypothetical protein